MARPHQPMKREQIEAFFRRLAEANPTPTTELEYGSPFQLLVAVVAISRGTPGG